MFSRESLGTLLSVTLVTLLIWLWAAGATKAQQVHWAQLQFAPGNASVRWLVTPRSQPVRVEIEGSRWSLQKAAELLKTPLTIDLLAEPGPQDKDLTPELNRLESLRETGVRVLSCEPQRVTVSVDRREQVTAPVRASLAGVQTVGEIEVDPKEAVVSVPSLQLRQVGREMTLEAIVPPATLRELAPGVKHTLDAAIRLPDALDAVGADVEPSSVKVSFTIRSRTEETLLETVRVQVAGPHKDFDDYAVEVLDDTLRNVTVSGESDLIRRITAREVPVVALVHLTHDDKEKGIQAKRVSGFLAISRDGTATMVNGRVGASTDPPEIRLNITKRSPIESPPSPGALQPESTARPGLP